MGPPGVGKGTQAACIEKHFNIIHLSTGEILRDEIEGNTRIGKQAKGFIDLGQLVPDPILLDIIEIRLVHDDCKNGFLLDGFPRTLPQADAVTNAGIEIDAVIEIDVADSVIVKRMSGRRAHLASGRTYHLEYNPPKVAGKDDETGEELVQRPDDKEDVVIDRLKVYHELTQPLIGYYKEKSNTVSTLIYITVDGTAHITDVEAAITAKLG